MEIVKTNATKIYRNFMHDSLYRNSIYLAFSTGITSLIGFLFWIVSAHLFASKQIGLATGLISAVGVISSFGMLGLNNTLLRFLSSTDQRRQMINTAITVVGIIAILLGAAYIIGIRFFSPKLIGIHHNLLLSTIFPFICAGVIINIITDSIFLSYRAAHLMLIIDSTTSAIKLATIFLLTRSNTYGVFYAYSMATAAGAVVSVVVIALKLKQVYRPALNRQVLRRTFHFSLGTYLASLLGHLPTLVLPLIVLNLLGPSSSAIFYIDTMIVTILLVLGQGPANVLFSESSNNTERLTENIKKALRISALILLPALLVLGVLGKAILSAFGHQYARNGLFTLYALSASVIFVTIQGIYEIELRMKFRLKELVALEIVTGIFSLGIVIVLTARHSLNLFAIGWVIGQALSTVLFVSVSRRLTMKPMA